jgi:hypothetical protein
MNNNIFISNKDKFNPDVLNNLSKKKNERNNIRFNNINEIYNPITNIIPDKITSQKDLLLNIKSSNVNINDLINQKEKERRLQDEKLKPIKTNININQKQDNIDYNIESYNEMKNKSEQYKKQIELQKRKNDNVYNELYKLGIIKN